MHYVSALPSVAGNSDFAGDSVAFSGQAGQVSPMAGMDMDRIRDAIEESSVSALVTTSAPVPPLGNGGPPGGPRQVSRRVPLLLRLVDWGRAG